MAVSRLVLALSWDVVIYIFQVPPPMLGSKGENPVCFYVHLNNILPENKPIAKITLSWSWHSTDKAIKLVALS